MWLVWQGHLTLGDIKSIERKIMLNDIESKLLEKSGKIRLIFLHK
jgi:hypothetical protein